MTAPNVDEASDDWLSLWASAQDALEARTEFVVSRGATPLSATLQAEELRLPCLISNAIRHQPIMFPVLYETVTGHYRDTVTECMQRHTRKVYGTEVEELAKVVGETAATNPKATFEHQDELDEAMVQRVVSTVRDLDAMYITTSCTIFACLDEYYAQHSSHLPLASAQHAASIEVVGAFPVASVRDAIIEGIERSRANPLSVAEVVQRLSGRHWAIAVGLYGPPTMQELYSVTDVFRIVLAFLT